MPNLKHSNSSVKAAELFRYLKLSTYVTVNMNEITEAVTASQGVRRAKENLKSTNTWEVQKLIPGAIHSLWWIRVASKYGYSTQVEGCIARASNTTYSNLVRSVTADSTMEFRC